MGIACTGLRAWSAALAGGGILDWGDGISPRQCLLHGELLGQSSVIWDMGLVYPFQVDTHSD